MTNILNIIIQILFTSFSMFWEVLWPLIFGFILSAVVQAFVSHKTLANTLGDDSPKSLTLATLFGIASSSCSYAAVALSRSLFQKGASFTSSMVFELASTNLVIELGIILIVLLGWQFMTAEFIGGIIMVILLAIIFHFTLTSRRIALAQRQAAKGLSGRMEGHAAMEMGVEISNFQFSISNINKILNSVANYFVMEVAAIGIDIVIGFLIAGTLAVLVPHSFWQAFFLSGNPTLAKIEGPLVGPLVAIFSFVCSIGNVPLAAVLWQGGISFGGVVSFIFADLIILPILNIYRKYYGLKVAAYIFITFYIVMALAGYIVEFLFSILNITPTNRHIVVINQGMQWNYTTWLNIVFLFFAIILVYKFIKNGGLPMLSMMEKVEEGKSCCQR
ncbi:MAG TPA: permease [Patescibacteria group bacterium]|nr:permease [Patescibacteria group bacterium]